MASSPLAYVTFLIRNDSYLPGALLLAYGLHKQRAAAEKVCLVTPEISKHATALLEVVYDHVIEIDNIILPIKNCQSRQYLPYTLTRLQALRLGSDGDLGLHYKKIVLLDSDILPIRYYDHLFLVDTPAGVINEKKKNFSCFNGEGSETASDPVYRGRWHWHNIYCDIPHGARVPRRITDKVQIDPANYGVNTSLLVLAPSMMEYNDIIYDLRDQHVRNWICELKWPDMQYLTLWWSGQWHNIDLNFAGIKGFPSISVLFGNHYVGVKPWNVHHKIISQRSHQFEDIQFWYAEFTNMLSEFAVLKSSRQLASILGHAEKVLGRSDGRGN
jgi:glycogenin glucosyltransferase